MPRRYPSTVDRLDPVLREEIARLRVDKGFTIDQIVDHLKTMDVAISRAALGRHIKKLEDKVGARIRELRSTSEAIGKALDERDDQKVGALNRELAHSIVMRLATAQNEDGDDVQFNPMEAMLIAKALDHLASAEKKDTDRLLKVRKETAEKALKAVDDELKAAKQPGLSQDTVDSIKRKILGLE